MGLSSSKSSQKTVPVYAPQLEAMAGNVNSAYNSAAPKITGITDQLSTLVPGILDRYTNGDPNVSAASSYNADVLSGKYLTGNPYLETMVAQAGNDARNQTAAALGVRGLNGGSAFGDIISRNVTEAGNTLRFNNYNVERGRMDSAASLAPSLAAAQYLPIDIVTQIAQAQGIPLQAASGAAAATGGLLGAYTNQKVTGSPSIMDGIGQAINIGKSVAGLF
jgi:hypothetical protein